MNVPLLLNRPTFLSRLRDDAVSFAAAPASARPLAALRIGLAAVLLFQAFSLAGSLPALYGSRGVVQWSVMEGTLPAGMPRIAWLTRALAPLGVSDLLGVRVVFLLYVVSLACLLIGWRTCTGAVVAWLTHLMLKTTGHASIYGVDEFAHIALFYCIWMPVGRTLSLDATAGRAGEDPSVLARVSLRVLQIHLCVVYLSSGIEKATGVQWWNGEAIWRSMMRPDMNMLDVTWLPSVPWLAMALCWGTLAVEIGYAFLVWPRRTRKWMALATLGLHAGIAVGLGLVSFALVMMVLTGSAFLVSAEPAVEAGRLA